MLSCDEFSEVDSTAWQFSPRQDKPDKGKKYGSCNVTACQRPGAVYFNKSTQAYYCEECAAEINWPGGRADTMALYGVPLLCELDEAEDEECEFCGLVGPDICDEPPVDYCERALSWLERRVK